MPSPLNGLIAPAASPTMSELGPVDGWMANPIGSLPPVGGPHEVSGESPHDRGADCTKASIRWLVFNPFHRPETVSSPTPTFTRPSPIGKIHPYPGTTAPERSFRSRCDSMYKSSWRSEV